MSSSATEKVEIFLSYSRQDEPLLRELEKHLAALRREGRIATWNDRMLEAGTEWEPELRRRLESARVLLLLVSPDFLHSEFCWSVEMTTALARHDAGAATVIPIILRTCDWKNTALAKLQVLPKDGLPVRRWPDQDEAFFDVVQGLRKTLAGLGPRSAPISPELPPPITELSSGEDDLIGEVVAESISPDGRFRIEAIKTSTGRNTFLVFENGFLIRAINHQETVHRLAFSEDSSRLAATFDGHLRLYDSKLMLLSQVQAKGGDQPEEIRFLPGGNSLAVAFRDNTRLDIYSAWNLDFQDSAQNPLGANGKLPRQVDYLYGFDPIVSQS